MIVQQITNKLQDIGHSGDADKEIYIKVLDSYYKVGNVQRVVVGDKTVYAIKAEPMGVNND